MSLQKGARFNGKVRMHNITNDLCGSSQCHLVRGDLTLDISADTDGLGYDLLGSTSKS